MGRNFITATQVAEMFGVKEGTVSRWRQRKTGPAFYKVGRSIRYDKKEIEIMMMKRGLIKEEE
jgi:predicted DNA-binding transcriptional regulator AlpA